MSRVLVLGAAGSLGGHVLRLGVAGSTPDPRGGVSAEPAQHIEPTQR
jgi:hypothetical protein